VSRKTIRPGDEQKDSSLVPYKTTNSSASVIKGIPASTLPDSALADGFNIITGPALVAEGRTGCRLWTTTPLPSMENRDGYTASKVGAVVTSPVDIFTEDDVGNFFVWPGAEEQHDEIVEYLAPNRVRVGIVGSKALIYGCRLVGKTNLWQFHKIQKKWVLVLGTDIYVADPEMTSFVKCMVISRDNIQSAISGYSDFDDNSALIFNSAGMFKLDLSTTIPKAYRINTPIPNRAIPSIDRTELTNYQYRYLYAGSRIAGNGNLRDRLTPERIEQESGTNVWGDDYRDYSEIWVDEPIGGSSKTYGKLVCGLLAGGFAAVTGWTGIAGNGSFSITINGEGPYEIVVDFSATVGVLLNMPDVARLIETGIQSYWPEATCEFSAGRFVITGGRALSGAISYLVAGTVGTDIADSMSGTAPTGAVVSNPRINTPKLIGPLYVPNVENTDPEEYQWHLTHFPIYRSRDLNNQYKIETQDGQYNDPNTFILAKELRMCAAFYAIRGGGVITALVGEFEEADVGSVIEWEDGSRDTIDTYINKTMVLYNTAGYYYGDPDVIMAAAIGNGRVMRASQTGNTVTRTHGGAFSASDVRKTIHWANGYRSYIVSVLSANQVEVEDDFGKGVQGFTMDPVYRNFYDTTSDEQLDTRKTTLLLKQRFWQAMENGNVGCKIPGLVFVARRGSGEMSFGQVPDSGEHLCGYHDKAYQITKKVADDIQFMWLFKNVLTIWTSRKTWRWPTDAYEFVTNNNTKDAILVITGLEVADEDRGLYDWGSFEPIGDGRAMLLTNEPGGLGWRTFDGFQYGPNILEVAEIGNERLPEIGDMQKATRALYDGYMGLMLWGRA